MTYETDREALLDAMNREHKAMLRASEWARVLVDVAPQSGCHLAALAWCLRSDAVWREAEDALEDYDWDAPTRAFHEEVARRLIAANTPTDAQVDAALARMDHLLGPGWLEAAE